MKQHQLPLQQLCDDAIRAVLAAGEYIQGVDRAEIRPQHKDVGNSMASQVVTEVDLRSESIIREILDASCKYWDVAFVAEESAQSPAEKLAARLEKPYFWCVDPLDGTLPFTEGRPGYAVSIALVARCGEPLLGVVYDPLESSLMHAVKEQGSYLNGVKFSPITADPESLVVFADASLEQHENYHDLLGVLDICRQQSGLERLDIVYGNGAVKNACNVLGSPEACYIKLPQPKLGGGSIWDFAATTCLFNESGAWVSDVYGNPLDLNREDSTFMNHRGVVFASSALIARTLLEKMSSF